MTILSQLSLIYPNIEDLTNQYAYSFMPSVINFDKHTWIDVMVM